MDGLGQRAQEGCMHSLNKNRVGGYCGNNNALLALLALINNDMAKKRRE